jgi:FdhD protein
MEIGYRSIRRYREDGDELVDMRDELAVEDYLEIAVEGEPYAVTMRLPGRDHDLAAGFCFSEGLIDAPEDIQWMRHCDRGPSENRIQVLLRDPGRVRRPAGDAGRSHLSRSSCGVCGKTDFEEIHLRVPPVGDSVRMGGADLLRIGREFGNRLDMFSRTGCTHGATLFTSELQEIDLAEDIGRHNALDKVIGAALRGGCLPEGVVCVVSSRLSLEMVQKAARAGVEILAGVSAATTMAAEYAERYGLTLVGFLRDRRMNVYTLPHRISSRSLPR